MTSPLGFYESISSAAGTADEPVDTGRAWTMLNNIQHMADVYPGYRVNYMGVADATVDGGRLVSFANAGGAGFVGWSHTFPLTMKPNGKTVGVDFRAAASIESGTGTVVARILPARAPINVLGTSPTDPDLLWYFTDTFTDASAAWVVDTFGPTDATAAAASARAVTTIDGAVMNPAIVMMVRAEVLCFGAGMTTADEIRIHGVSIREYPL